MEQKCSNKGCTGCSYIDLAPIFRIHLNSPIVLPVLLVTVIMWDSPSGIWGQHTQVFCAINCLEGFICSFISLFQCDGVEITQKIQDLKLHCLVILNIPRSVEELDACASLPQKRPVFDAEVKWQNVFCANRQEDQRKIWMDMNLRSQEALCAG